ncbi:MAG: hypothetical protein ACWGQW_03790 [bacterium]
MAKILKNFDASRHSRGEYPWDEWSDGQARRIIQGEDFHCLVDTMKVAIRKQAGRLGRSATVVDGEEPNSIDFVIHPEKESTSGKKAS